MAQVSRLLLRNMASRAFSYRQHGKVGVRWLSNAVEKAGEDSSSPGQDIAVSDKEEQRKAPSRRGQGRWKRRRDGTDTYGLVPFGFRDFFVPMGLGTRMQTLDNLNRLLSNFVSTRFDDDKLDELSPDYWLTEDDKAYRVRFEMPGLSKEDVKVSVRDGYLVVRGEHKEDKEEGFAESRGVWSRSYGYYFSSFLLPEDVKADEIIAEMKHGVLEIVVPKAEDEARTVKVVEVM